jgi:hypothetical protein
MPATTLKYPRRSTKRFLVLSAIGQTATQSTGNASRNVRLPGAADRAAALDGEVRRETTQLNDWVTCVSANTPKGKAEIQSLAGKISAAKEQIARIDAEQKGERASSPDSGLHGEQLQATVLTRLWQQSTQASTRAGVLLNTWA